MAKRKTEWTEAKIDKYIKEGRGQGVGGNYIPWIKIQDFPSRGLSTRTSGWKTNRIHHFLSKLELQFFYICEWDLRVIDIREQFPLYRIDTMKYAEEKGLKHPIDPITKVPIVMTTDFLLTVKTDSGNFCIARTIKPSIELEKARVLEKFEIERHYWSERNVDWGIVTEKELSVNIVNNIEWLHNAYNFHEAFLESTYKSLSEQLKFELQQPGKPIIDILLDFEGRRGLENGTGISIFQNLICNRQIIVDMENPLRLDKLNNELIMSIKGDSKKGVI